MAIYVDFDKTLAYHEEEWGASRIGKPLLPMVMRIKHWLRLGKEIKIFTARASHGPEMIGEIQDWLESVGLPRLEVTNIKGHDIEFLVDDRARRAIPNTGEME